MTEDEAKERWCPFYRVSAAGVEADVELYDTRKHNPSPSGQLGDGRCIASDCMAWRWKSLPEGTSLKLADLDIDEGYCGLAGRPGP